MASPFHYRDMKLLVYRKGNRRVLNSTHGGVRGRRETASYSIVHSMECALFQRHKRQADSGRLLGVNNDMFADFICMQVFMGERRLNFIEAATSTMSRLASTREIFDVL